MSRICWRCAANDARALLIGLACGWARAWREAGRSGWYKPRVGLAWLYWRCWYWPGYVHPHGWGIMCVHGVKP